MVRLQFPLVVLFIILSVCAVAFAFLRSWWLAEETRDYGSIRVHKWIYPSQDEKGRRCMQYSITFSDGSFSEGYDDYEPFGEVDSARIHHDGPPESYSIEATGTGVVRPISPQIAERFKQIREYVEAHCQIDELPWTKVKIQSPTEALPPSVVVKFDRAFPKPPWLTASPSSQTKPK